MYIQVRLLKGFKEPLTYQVPPTWNEPNLVGKIVRVPIRNQVCPAIVTEQMEQWADEGKYAIRHALAIEQFPADLHYHEFIDLLAAYNQVEPVHFIKRIGSFLKEKEDPKSALTPDLDSSITEVVLTDEQTKVVTFLNYYLHNPVFMPTVLHGVTGSGKTEVYKQLIIQNCALNKTTILLLPEVTLALQFEHIMRTQLPKNILIFGFHSATPAKHKNLLWQSLMHNVPVLIIGVHLPILLPVPNLGLIIVDEEHEVGYQEKKHPKINSKDAATMRAQSANIPILLGSATPSVATLYNVKTKGWKFFQLKKRFGGSFPKIKTVFLADKKQRKSFWISKELEDAIKDRLHKREQIIIFLNRRGFSFFVQCKGCSFIFSCKNCSVSLTLHNNDLLTCHYCTTSMMLPPCCPSCKADQAQFIKKGIGTQQVVTILEKLFPFAKVARADMDTTLKKKEWQQTVQDFHAGNLDILVGTQTITKGYHFPNVTLVGVLWADLNLHFPMFNAAETCLQQLIQVAGRAGRARSESLVLVQTMVNHPIFAYLNEVDYLKFYATEIEKRLMIGYPPAKQLVEIELKHATEEIVDNNATNLMNLLLEYADTHKLQLTILGPAKPPVHKIKNTHTRKIYIKANAMEDIVKIYAIINHRKFKSQIFFTPSPIN